MSLFSQLLVALELLEEREQQHRLPAPLRDGAVNGLDALRRVDAVREDRPAIARSPLPLLARHGGEPRELMRQVLRFLDVQLDERLEDGPRLDERARLW